MKSMTGFGRGEASRGGTKYRVEISSVNRKQSDITVNLPRELVELESAVRKLIATRVSRGRVSVRIALDAPKGARQSLVVDNAIAEAYRIQLESMAKSFGAGVGTVKPVDLLRAPGVFSLEDIAAEAGEAWPSLQRALKKALREFDRMRRTEGSELQADLLERVKAVARQAEQIEELAPGVVERYRANLLRRLRESGIGVDLDDERVLKEIGIFAERCDISEELTRLRSHLGQFRTYLKSRGPVGRSMDFLAQELSREINTIGSKANNAAIARHVVEAKTEVEKIREQVQNIE